MSLRFTQSLAAWGTQEFDATLKAEIEALDPSLLPLQEALTQTSYSVSSRVGARIIHTAREGDALRVKAGIFHSGVIAGCSCADDPTPMDEVTEYCEMEFVIDMRDGRASATLVPD